MEKINIFYLIHRELFADVMWCYQKYKAENETIKEASEETIGIIIKNLVYSRTFVLYSFAEGMHHNPF